MHSNEPDVAQSENQDGEVISSLRLAGFRGSVRTVLQPERLLFEHAGGNYLRMGYDKIARMRHHQFPLIPHWTAMIAFLGIYAALRVFSGPIQLWVGLSAASTLIAWLAIRLPALTIDAAEDGCYTVFGPESQLLRLRLVIERLQDGTAFQEAFEGLDELVNAQFPSSGVFQEIANIIAHKSAEDTHLDAAMSELIAADAVDEQQAVLSEDVISTGEPLQMLNMDPRDHGSISRARDVRHQMVTPRHDGWTNAAAGTQPVPPAAQQSPPWDASPSQAPAYHQEPQRFHHPEAEQSSMFTAPATTQPSMFAEPESEPTALDSMFGFNLGVEETDRDPESFFGEPAVERPSVGDWLTTGENETRPSNPPPRASEAPNHGLPSSSPRPQSRPQNFINSFQPTGFSSPLNQMDAQLHDWSREEQQIETDEVSMPSAGIVSRAKLTDDQPIEAGIVPNKPPVELKRIQRDGGRRLKRLDSAGSPQRNLTLREVIAPVWKIKVPEALRRTLRGEGQTAPPPPAPSRTLDALRVQAQHSHEAQVANALRGLTGINRDKEITNILLEDVAPELVDEVIPINFEMLTPTTDSSTSVNLPGVSRLD